MDQIEHACFELPDGSLRFEPELARRMAQAGTCVTPTIQLYRDALSHLQKKAAAEGLNPTEQQRLTLLPGVIESKLEAGGDTRKRLSPGFAEFNRISGCLFT